MEEIDERIYRETIAPKLFAGVTNAKQPVAYILGGQPSSGKSALIDLLRSQHPGEGVVEINGDRFRKYHPDFERLSDTLPRLMPRITQPRVNAWIERAMADGVDRRHNMVIEGTMRNPDVPLRTAEFLRKKGYRVEMHVLAVRPEVTAIGIVERYEADKAAGNAARFTHPADHQSAVDGIPKSLEAIERTKAADYLAIYHRSPYHQGRLRHHSVKIYSNELIAGEWEKAPRATEVLKEEWQRPLTTREADRLMADVHEARHLMGRKNKPTVLESDTYDRHIATAEKLYTEAQAAALAERPLSPDQARAKIFERFASRDGIATDPALESAYEALNGLRTVARQQPGAVQEAFIRRGQERIAAELAQGRAPKLSGQPIQLDKPRGLDR